MTTLKSKLEIESWINDALNKLQPTELKSYDSLITKVLDLRALKSCDQDTSKFLENISGYLEVFVGDGDHWSFIEPSSNNFVKRTTEKIRISNLCSNGLYYFYSITLFNETFERYKTINNYNELYVAPMYNLLIENNLLVKYVLLEKNETIFSGTPEEYEDLIKIIK